MFHLSCVCHLLKNLMQKCHREKLQILYAIHLLIKSEIEGKGGGGGKDVFKLVGFNQPPSTSLTFHTATM